MSLDKLATVLKGGPGSGHRGHAGRPGQQGGGAPSGGGMSAASAKPLNNAQNNDKVLAELQSKDPEYKGKTGMKRLLANITDASEEKLPVIKGDSVKFRKSYFYRHGNDASGFGANVVKKLESAGIKGATVTDTKDEWATWPKTSYFVAEVTIPGLH